MKNKIEDLRNHLFAQLERLGDEDMTEDKLAMEMKRAKSISDVATVIVESAKVEVQLMTEIAWGGTGFIQEQKTQLPSAGEIVPSNLKLDGAGNVQQA